MRIVPQSAELLWITPNPEMAIELAARTCYKSEGTSEPSGEWIKRTLIKPGHHAMLEHACASLRFVTDRGVTHEYVRHRLSAYAQVSTRYCNYSKEKFGREITVIQPPDLEGEAYRAWKLTCEQAESSYFRMIDAGCPPQIARSVLPTCLKAEIVGTCNLREWRHIFTMRTVKRAQPQIREVMRMAFNILYAECPSIFEDLVPIATGD